MRRNSVMQLTAAAPSASESYRIRAGTDNIFFICDVQEQPGGLLFDIWKWCFKPFCFLFRGKTHHLTFSCKSHSYINGDVLKGCSWSAVTWFSAGNTNQLLINDDVELSINWLTLCWVFTPFTDKLMARSVSQLDMPYVVSTENVGLVIECRKLLLLMYFRFEIR